MKTRNLLYLVWLIPAYLAFLLVHQIKVYVDVNHTMEYGQVYEAEVTDFRIKQIAAQTNGYIVVKFTTKTGMDIEQKLSLGIHHAARLMQTEKLEIKYLEGAGQEIILIPTFETQQHIIRFNIMILAASFLLLLALSLGVTRFLHRKKAAGFPTTEFELINN